MNTFLLVLLMSTTVPADDKALFRSAEPGPDAAIAYELFRADDKDAACAAFLEQVRNGSPDPWAYRGATICASELPATREKVVVVLDALAQEATLVLFARGNLSYLDEEWDSAEEFLRRAVARAQDLALAWNVLGAAVREQGDPQAAVPLIEKALSLAPGLEVAKDELERTRLYTKVFERLLGLLAELPRRWVELPQARVPMSGNSIADALSGTSEEYRQESLAFISFLASTPLEDRKELISWWLEKKSPQEADLWLPLLLAQHEMIRSVDEAALIVEAWLQWAAALGRKDVLLVAASMSINLLEIRVEGETLLPIVRRWVQLPQTIHTKYGLSQVINSYAKILFSSGDNHNALAAYREARHLSQDVGDQNGQGNTFLGEARVLLLLGEVEGALSAYRKARQLFQDLPSQLENQIGLGNAFLGEAELLFRLGDNEGALSTYREARQISQAAGDQMCQGNAWNGEAKILSFLGNHEGALAAYRGARQIFQAVGSPLGQAITWDGEGSVLFRMGDQQEALTAYREAHQIFETIGSQHGQGNSRLGEARVLSLLGEKGGALSAYQEARRLFQAMGDQLGQGSAWDGEAEILYQMGDHNGALSAYREARRLFLVVDDQLGQGNTWLGEANIPLLLGDHEAALAAYREARRLYQAIGDQLGQGNAWAGEADVLSLLGEPESALSAYQEAHQLFQAAGDQNGQGNTLFGEARILSLFFRDHETALSTYREAHRLFQAIGSPLGQGNALDGEADVLFQLGLHEDALSAYREARQLFQAAGDQVGQGNTFLGEADVLFQLGENEGVTKTAARAAEFFRQMQSIPNEINALVVEGMARRLLGETQRPMELAEKAIDLFSTRRQDYIAEEHRTNFDAGFARIYDLLLPLLSRQPDRLEQTLERLEEARSRVLLDLLRTGRIGGSDAPLDLRQENQRLLTDLARTSDALGQASDPVLRHELLTKSQALDAALQRNLYDRIAAERREQTFGEPLDVSGIRTLANEIGPVVFYYAAEDELIAFLVLPSGSIQLRSIDVTRNDLGERVDDFLYDLTNAHLGQRAEHQAEDLWRTLVAPFTEDLPPSGPITFVPHGSLHGLPFEALVEPRSSQRLFERWDVRVAPSASALAIARQRHAKPTGDDSLVAFAAGVGLNLPAKDVRAVTRFFPASQQKAFGPAEANFHFYLGHASKADHLLIATHGVHAQASRRGTYLQIKPTPHVHDERLTAAEIAATPLSAELVTLAACDTDRGDALLSDERLTLTRSFLIAGAASVLATRWRIPEDRSTTRFLVDFYEAYRTGGPDGKGIQKDQALTLARRKAVERGEPAQVWAAWVLVGDAR